MKNTILTALEDRGVYDYCLYERCGRLVLEVPERKVELAETILENEGINLMQMTINGIL